MENDSQFFDLDEIGRRLAELLGPDYTGESFPSIYMQYRFSDLDLNSREALLAAITHFPGKKDLYPKELSKLLDLSEEEIQSSLNALEEKGVIIYSDAHYLISEAAEKTINQTDVTVDTLKVPKVSFGERLQTILFSFCKANLIVLNGLITEYPDEQFSKGWKWVASEMTEKDDLIALGNLAAHFLRHGAHPLDLEDDSLGQLFMPSVSRLIAKRLVILVPRDSRSWGENAESPEQVMLSPNACRLLFKGYPVITISNLAYAAEFVGHAEIPLKHLVFDEAVVRTVDRLRVACDQQKFHQITRRLQEKKRPAGVTCLLYGAPGTGKTELVRQIARECGRDLVVVDTAKINGCYIGESEKAVRNLFLQYRYIHAMSDNVPILLLNEADSILGRRIEQPNGSATKADNNVLTIFLQELERFEGLLIATTNLPGALDEAFDRRFLLKVKLDVPSVSVRVRIWRENVASLSVAQAKMLAERFPFAGGSISNVARKADVFAVIDGREPSFDDIISYCKDETILLQPMPDSVRTVKIDLNKQGNNIS